jgi:uncharacterized protein with HEPN domain
MRDDRERLRDILRAIDSIIEKARSGRDAFFSDEMLQVWKVVEHDLASLRKKVIDILA